MITVIVLVKLQRKTEAESSDSTLQTAKSDKRKESFLQDFSLGVF